MSDNKNKFLISGVIFILAISIRFFYWSGFYNTALDKWYLWEQTDMATYVEQAKRIYTESWLAEEPYHPYHGWQYVAPESDWNKWYGRGVFHQAPVYSYLLAFFSLVTDEPIRVVKVIQFIVGSLSCVLIFLICNYLAGLYAASVAGVLSAIYAPMFYLEAHIVRESFAIFSMLFVFCLLIKYFLLKKDHPKTTFFIMSIGIALGLFMQLHQMGLILILTIILFLVLRNLMKYKQALIQISLLITGFIIGFSPWMIRNIEVGAPLFSVSSRMPIVFVQSNEAKAPEGGVSFSLATTSMVNILDAAYENKENVLVGVIKSYKGDTKLLLKNWWQRFKTVWTRYEIADNTSYYFFMEMVPFLKWMPNFSMVFPLGATAMIMLLVPALKSSQTLIQNNNGKNTHLQFEPNNMNNNLEKQYIHFILIFWAIVLFMSLSFAHGSGRFRIYLVPFFIIYTGILLNIVINAYRKKDAKFMVIIMITVVIMVLFQRDSSNLKHGLPGRPDYSAAYDLAILTGDVPTLLKVCSNSNKYYPDLLIDLDINKNSL